MIHRQCHGVAKSEHDAIVEGASLPQQYCLPLRVDSSGGRPPGAQQEATLPAMSCQAEKQNCSIAAQRPKKYINLKPMTPVHVSHCVVGAPRPNLRRRHLHSRICVGCKQLGCGVIRSTVKRILTELCWQKVVPPHFSTSK